MGFEARYESNFFAFQDFGIFIGNYCKSGPFNVICRKHTLFTSSLQKLKAQPCDHDLAAEGPSCMRQMGFGICESSTQLIIEPGYENKKKNKKVGLVLKLCVKQLKAPA